MLLLYLNILIDDVGENLLSSDIQNNNNNNNIEYIFVDIIFQQI